MSNAANSFSEQILGGAAPAPHPMRLRHHLEVLPGGQFGIEGRRVGYQLDQRPELPFVVLKRQTLDGHRAVAGANPPPKRPEQRGLAGPVGSHQNPVLTARHGEVDSAERRVRAKPHPKIPAGDSCHDAAPVRPHVRPVPRAPSGAAGDPGHSTRARPFRQWLRTGAMAWLVCVDGGCSWRMRSRASGMGQHADQISGGGPVVVVIRSLTPKPLWRRLRLEARGRTRLETEGLNVVALVERLPAGMGSGASPHGSADLISRRGAPGPGGRRLGTA